MEASGAVLAPGVSETAERLFRENSGWIYGYCLRLLRSPEDAEDALQATYLNACRSLHQGVRPRMDSAWLLRITQNACLTRLRSLGRRARFEHAKDFALFEETVPAPDRSADDLIGLTEALASLPERQRRAILLREWQGLSHSEVAQRLGLTQAAAETLIFRARRSLAAALENPAKGVRPRSLHALDLGGLLAAIKGFFVGTAGGKTVAAVLVAATTTATVVATDPAGVWRDRPEHVTAPAVGQASRPAPALRTALLGVPVRGAGDTAERRVGPNEPATHPAERGRAFGQATAAAARAKGNNGNGKALGHAKKVAAAAKSSNGRGTPAGGRPDSAGQAGPPPHAQANGHATHNGANKPSESE